MGEDGAPYDRHARLYDRVIGNRVYNRVAWGASPSGYTRFAADALTTGEGPLLDVGCGTAVFTAPAYRHATRPLVLVDRSLAMLARAAERLAGVPATYVQADLHDLPFARGRFDAVACFGVLHVLDDPWAALGALRDQVAPGGHVFVSMLVADRPVGRAWLAALHRRGEVGPPRRADEPSAAARKCFGRSVDVRRRGSMAELRATVAA